MSNLNEKVREKLNEVDYITHLDKYNIETINDIWDSLKHLFEDFTEPHDELFKVFLEEFSKWDETNYKIFVQ